MSKSTVGGWGRIVRPRKREIWHQINYFWDQMPMAYCLLPLDLEYAEFARELPEGARACLTCAQQRAKTRKTSG